MSDENRPLKYEKDKFLPDGEKVKVAVCENAEAALLAIDGFITTNSSSKEKKQCRIVFDQHGGKGGVNDINIEEKDAKAMLKKLAEAGYQHIIISDHACHEGTAKHFRKVAQDFAKQKGVNIRVRYAKEDRLCINGLKENNGKLRFTQPTIGQDGDARSREVEMFGPESNVTNPSTTQLSAAPVKRSI